MKSLFQGRLLLCFEESTIQALWLLKIKLGTYPGMEESLGSHSTLLDNGTLLFVLWLEGHLQSCLERREGEVPGLFLPRS